MGHGLTDFFWKYTDLFLNIFVYTPYSIKKFHTNHQVQVTILGQTLNPQPQLALQAKAAQSRL